MYDAHICFKLDSQVNAKLVQCKRLSVAYLARWYISLCYPHLAPRTVSVQSQYNLSWQLFFETWQNLKRVCFIIYCFRIIFWICYSTAIEGWVKIIWHLLGGGGRRPWCCFFFQLLFLRPFRIIPWLFCTWFGFYIKILSWRWMWMTMQWLIKFHLDYWWEKVEFNILIFHFFCGSSVDCRRCQ